MDQVELPSQLPPPLPSKTKLIAIGLVILLAIILIVFLLAGRGRKVTAPGALSDTQKQALLKSLTQGAPTANLTAKQKEDLLKTLKSSTQTTTTLTPEQKAKLLESLQAP